MSDTRRPDEFSEDTIEKKVAAPSERRARGPDRLANPLAQLVKKFASKYGFAETDIVSNWAEIAGAEAAKMAVPVRISFPMGKRAGGTLHIRLKNSSYAAVMQYQFPAIIERINTHFGYGAIRAVKIKY